MAARATPGLFPQLAAKHAFAQFMGLLGGFLPATQSNCILVRARGMSAALFSDWGAGAPKTSAEEARRRVNVVRILVFDTGKYEN